MDDKVMYGIIGTAVGATGAGLSVTELQAIISIIVTITGFVISVLIPLIMKLVKKIKAAKEDGVITKEEMEDIASTGKEIIDETGSLVNQIKEESEKSEGEKK
jgi:predicted membrane-bound spermidine synthase